MGADAGIFQQYLTPVRSVADYRGDMDKQEQNALTLASSRLAQQQAQQDMADNQAARTASIQAGGDQNKLLQLLQQSGNYKAAGAVQKQMLDSQKTQADTKLATAHAGNFEQSTEASKATQRYEAAQHHAQGLAYVQTPEDAKIYISQGISKGVFPPMTPEEITQKLSQYPSVDAFKKQAAEASLPVLDKYKVEAENARNKLTNETSIANNAANNATAIRGQNMTSATAEAGRESGKIPAGYRALKDGSLQAIPGGPADIKNSAESVKKVGEAKDVLSLLDEVDKLLPKATGSYVGAGMDSAAGAIGLGTKGAETTAQLKAIEGALISKMPKMSGPQSDKDVLLYRQMAGQVGDQTVPVKQRQAAADMVRKLNEKYAGMQDGSSRASSHVDSLLDKYK